jgi:hypothetical protein
MRFSSVAFVFALAFAAGGPVFAGMKTVKVTLPDKAVVTAELALAPAERERGLMFRAGLAEKRGMLFVFDEDAPLSFWMKNTLIDLAIVFIGADKKITVGYDHVPKSRAGASDEEVAKVLGYGKYVIELPAGSCKKHKLVNGAVIGFELPEEKKK